MAKQNGPTGFKRAQKIRRRQEAEERNEHWNKLSLQEKLIALDNRPGLSKKQLVKLGAWMD